MSSTDSPLDNPETFEKLEHLVELMANVTWRDAVRNHFSLTDGSLYFDPSSLAVELREALKDGRLTRDNLPCCAMSLATVCSMLIKLDESEDGRIIIPRGVKIDFKQMRGSLTLMGLDFISRTIDEEKAKRLETELREKADRGIIG